MKIDQNNSNWLIKLFYNTDGSPTNMGKTKGSTYADAVARAKDNMNASSWEAKYSRIQRVISSGEPLIEVGFKEFCSDYYFCSLNPAKGGMYEARQAYKQAVRGAKDIIDKQDFYGEGLVYTQEITNSEVFRKHLSTVVEKWVKGASLSEAEKRLLTSDPDAYESAFAGRSLNQKEIAFKQILDKNGISPVKNQKIQIYLQGNQFTVSGDLTKIQASVLEKALNDLGKSEKDNYRALYAMHNMTSYTKNVSQSQRLLSTAIVEAEYLLMEYTGGSIGLQDLTLNSEGQIQGLPEELVNRFDGIEITGNPVLPKEYESNLAKAKAWISDRANKLYLETAVKAVQEYGYENVPRHGFTFEYSNGELRAIDTYTKN